MNNKKCGSCANFIKMNLTPHGKKVKRGGLCDIYDYVVTTDAVVKDCTKFRSIKYNRKKIDTTSTNN